MTLPWNPRLLYLSDVDDTPATGKVFLSIICPSSSTKSVSDLLETVTIPRSLLCSPIPPNRKLHSCFTASSNVLPPGFFGHPDSPLPAGTLLGPESVSPPSQLLELLPRSTTQPKYMTRKGSAPWNSTFNPHTPALPSRHRHLILRHPPQPLKPRLPPNTGSKRTTTVLQSLSNHRR